MDILREILLEFFISNNFIANQNFIDIGINTKYSKIKITYDNLLEELKKLQENKFENKIKKIINISDNYKSFDFYCLDPDRETYNKIIYDIKIFYVCKLTEETIKIFFFIDKKKIKKNKEYAIIFNNKNIYLVCLNNKLSIIVDELDKNIELYGTSDDIIDSTEFIDEFKNYSINKNIQINDLTDLITDISIKSKVNMINTFIYKKINFNSKKCVKYIEDLHNILNNLDKNKIYIWFQLLANVCPVK
jgi:hypothetical protein